LMSGWSATNGRKLVFHILPDYKGLRDSPPVSVVHTFPVTTLR
jgi:hypothetical protein